MFYNGFIPIQISVEGHAGMKNKDGYEVCVAVSAISQAMAVALENTSGKAVKYKKKSGMFELAFDIRKGKKDIYAHAVVANAFIESIKALAKENKKYIDYKEHYNGE